MCAKRKTNEEIPVVDTVERIEETSLQKAIHNFMIPYSEYVILDRALPRVEDGLKPVQRRILYTMYEMGLKPEGETKKSARVVGDCMGKYHPHGDSSIYNAMVVLAQCFKTRIPLVKGQGNFGSTDGDGAAAMRYTEVKLEPFAMELLRDLDKDTVSWSPNYDDSLKEPDILPGRFPNLLVNGCPMGIAVGLTTKIPPHNLTEVIDGIVAYIDNPRITVKDLMQYIKGPDFPTGAYIDNKELLNMYEKGEGKFTLAAKYDIEIENSGRQNIVITELPYDLVRNKILTDIRGMIDSLSEKQGKNDHILSGITEISDESDKNGIRLVLKLKKGENATKIVKYLFEKTKLKQSYNAVFVAVVEGKPELLSLDQMIKFYVKHQKNIILNASKYEYNIAKKRAHILEGFVLVLPDIREIVEIVLSSNSTNEAKTRIRTRFGTSEVQTDAILATKLSNLTKLEVTKLEKELRELHRRIKELELIINSSRAQLEILKADLIEMRNKHRVKRQTIIVNDIDDTLIDPTSVSAKGGKAGYVVVDVDGTFKFVNPRQYHNARKSVNEQGFDGITKQVVYADSKDTVILFSSLGNCFRLQTEKAEEKRWNEQGNALMDVFEGVALGETVVSAIAINTENVSDDELFFFTKSGQCKRSALSDYVVNKDTYLGIVLKDGDELLSVERKREDTSLVVVTRNGMYLNFAKAEVNTTGRKSGGVSAINLADGDEVIFGGQVDVDVDSDELYPIGEIMIGTNRAYAKRVILAYINSAKRNTKGDKLISFEKDGDYLTFAFLVTNDFDFVVAGNDREFAVFNSEDVGIEQRKTKGKPLGKLTCTSYAVKEITDGVQ